CARDRGSGWSAHNSFDVW
nr:immunoglobulin heavy chain junction region [Macaca mulatta]MOW23870.1 immunoglobulin heavy chain junction region [Macaca mulatta]MOW23886.1 immunoglobulin heavy chain junction region [Macaca mulatta]MOW23905.1 immunoglobulin heavy chain junction region [Macaca mulatta]MOW23918.1 immunoglobulin heavy chain junction region [Macaca mulatta]